METRLNDFSSHSRTRRSTHGLVGVVHQVEHNKRPNPKEVVAAVDVEEAPDSLDKAARAS